MKAKKITQRLRERKMTLVKKKKRKRMANV
jgi:hypothetical protein